MYKYWNGAEHMDVSHGSHGNNAIVVLRYFCVKTFIVPWTLAGQCWRCLAFRLKDTRIQFTICALCCLCFFTLGHKSVHFIQRGNFVPTYI